MRFFLLRHGLFARSRRRCDLHVKLRALPPANRACHARELPDAPAETILPVAGVRLGIAQAGIRKANRRDLCLISLLPGARVAGVF